MASKNTTRHTQAGIHVCCELALKRAGERNTHGGAACAGNRPRERSLLRVLCVERLFQGLNKRPRAKGGKEVGRGATRGRSTNEVLSGNLGALCARKALKALGTSRSLRTYIPHVILHYYKHICTATKREYTAASGEQRDAAPSTPPPPALLLLLLPCSSSSSTLLRFNETPHEER